MILELKKKFCGKRIVKENGFITSIPHKKNIWQQKEVNDLGLLFSVTTSSHANNGIFMETTPIILWHSVICGKMHSDIFDKPGECHCQQSTYIVFWKHMLFPLLRHILWRVLVLFTSFVNLKLTLVFEMIKTDSKLSQRWDDTDSKLSQNCDKNWSTLAWAITKLELS